jgi:predicted O-methyltransferase YrrM
MKFSADWFSHNINGINHCFSKLQNRNKFLEIGCYEGLSTTWFIKNYLDDNGTITCIDTFLGSTEHQSYISDTLYETFMSNVTEIIGENQTLQVMQKKSYIALAELIVKEEKFDFIYIDGCHDTSVVLTDAVMSWPLLNSGGIMIFDDYTWGYPQPGITPFQSPKTGIDAFGQSFNNQFTQILVADQIGIMKL